MPAGNVIDLTVPDADGVMRGPIVLVVGNPGISFHFGDTLRLRIHAKVQVLKETEKTPAREYETLVELLNAQIMEVNP